MSKTDPRARSRAMLEGLHRAGARAMLRAFGLTDADFRKPQIGVGATWNKVTLCTSRPALAAHGGRATPKRAGSRASRIFLASDESSYMTGAELVIDGGALAQ